MTARWDGDTDLMKRPIDSRTEDEIMEAKREMEDFARHLLTNGAGPRPSRLARTAREIVPPRQSKGKHKGSKRAKKASRRGGNPAR